MKTRTTRSGIGDTGRGAQEELFGEPEDRQVGADADGEGGHRHEREARASQQDAAAVADIRE